MSHFPYISSLDESWQELVAWDDELYDPLFQGETSYTRAQEGSYVAVHQLSGSYTSEPTYLVSAPPSVADEPPSLEYTVSAPPSTLDGQSSFEHANGTSLSFDTTSTSPLAVQADSRYFGSFGACDNSLLSPLGATNDSPILDTRYDRIPETFTPHVTDSSHSFSGLDVRASRLFSNLGTWAEQPRIIEPIAEDDGGRAEVEPIAIPNSLSQNYNPTLPSYRRSEGEYDLHNRSRAITIPHVTRGPIGYNNRMSASASARRPPPMLSVSPVASRYPRSVALSRSASLSRRKTSTPSPSPDSYGWVSYHPNPLTHRLAPTSTEGIPGRAPKGRKRALTAEQRRHAALMRIVGACSNCQRRKEKCDPGTPCRACLEHYKGDLVNHPCRDHTLIDLSAAFLSDRLGWHPTTRPLESFVPAGNSEISKGVTYTLPLNFGFGPTFPVSVHAVQINDDNPLVHEHIIYSWPPQPYTGPPHKHAVLPAVLTANAQYHLMHTLDSHLSLLVAHHFRAFPLYCSPLRILRDVYVFSRSLPTSSPHYRILHQALKLLILVHIGGDITLPSRSESPMLEQFIHSTMDIPEDLTPTPCFIRSQFGAITPDLALSLMKDVLTSLEQLFLNKDCDDWPIALAVLTTVLMTVESIHYHAAKLPYHKLYDATRPLTAEEDVKIDDDHGVRSLLEFYSACFSGCHARLRPDWEGESTQSHQTGTPEDAFIQSLREAIRKADTSNYLIKKVKEKRQDDDMGYFFDRLVAHLFTIRP
ncbi:hypothetical protein G6011_01454 [Alternaria panax]|uniref:Zn(2)-C6 fungal-type domain-containing protein n=1 Tax=Alternaria panax TaxID=48097 RepID=A0AAD4IKX9_9PLEO|nr:hypothetical protein G6011_01454 [Alternaria panax]